MKRILHVFFALFAVVLFSQAAKVDTVTVVSAGMNKNIRNIVVVPDGLNAATKLPTVYLLHGAGGNCFDWIRMVPDIKKLSDLYQVLIVCPDGGITSWYYDSPIDNSYKYETYVTKELLPFIDQKYPTYQSAAYRAITGLSMGGHGGMYLSLRHQDLFAAGGSMSGGVDIRPFPNNWDISKRLGTIVEKPENWEKHTIVNMLDLLKGSNLKLIIDCGVNDFFYDVNMDLHNRLLKMKYPHDFITRPGVHNWPYWSNAVKYQFLFFNEVFHSKPSRR